MEKHIEVRTTEHKGIKVMVKIDYDNNQVSLVEKNEQMFKDTLFTSKKWVFANRGVEYMNGWLDVLEAMASAVKDAKSDLEKVLKAREVKKEKMVVDIILRKK